MRTTVFIFTAICLISCAETSEKAKDSSDSKDIISETKKVCEDFNTNLYKDQGPLEISDSKSNPIDQVKIAFKDNALEENTAYVASLTINTKDSIHYCSCYMDDKGNKIGGTNHSESKNPGPSLNEANFLKFKSAILNKDKAYITKMTTIEGFDAEMVLLYFEDSVFVEKLKAYTYDDLVDSDFNGTPVKGLSIEVSGSDESGEVYESGLFLYFEESEAGFKLVNLLAAG